MRSIRQRVLQIQEKEEKQKRHTRLIRNLLREVNDVLVVEGIDLVRLALQSPRRRPNTTSMGRARACPHRW